MDEAVFNAGPVPFRLRKFLLAAGKNLGLGLATVDHLSLEDFNYYWHCQQALIQAEDDQARGEASHEANIRRTIRLEASGKLDTQDSGYLNGKPFDPATATPHEIEAWLARMQQ